MKIAAKLFSMVLVLSMILSLGIFAFANEGGSSTASIVKNVHIPDKSATKPEETFEFYFTPVESGTTPFGESITGRIDFPVQTTAFTADTPYDYVSGSTDCVGTITKEGDLIEFTSDFNFEAATDYYFEWVVSENKGTSPGMTYDPTRYLMVLKAQVEKLEYLETPVKKYQMKNKTYTFYSEDGEEKFESMSFNNTYLEPAKSRLKVKNTVVDSSNNPISGKAFAYTMTVNKPDLWPDSSFSYSIYDKDGNLLPDLSGTANFGEMLSFNLEDGFRAELVLPEGCWYDILESGQTNYLPEVKYGADTAPTQDTTVTGDYGLSLAIPEASGAKAATQIRIDNDGSHAEFKNVKRDVSPTGILVRNLPYIVMAVVAGAGIALVIFSKKRRHYEE